MGGGSSHHVEYHHYVPNQQEQQAAAAREAAEQERQRSERAAQEAAIAAAAAAVEAARLTESRRLMDAGLVNKGAFHVAICGDSGVGKSTIVNVLRGVKKGDATYAEPSTGAEGTQKTTPYPHPRESRFVLWDTPGGSTTRHPAATYYADKCLHEFDMLVVVYTNRITELAEEIVKKAQASGKPVTLVYLKADVSVDSLLAEADLTTPAARDSLRKTISGEVSGKFGSDVAAGRLSWFIASSFDIRKGTAGMDEAGLISHLRERMTEKVGAAAASVLTLQAMRRV